MKKVLLFILALGLLFGFVACEEETPVKYTVHVDLNGHGENFDVTVSGGKVKGTVPSTPEDPDYDFGGWYLDEDCTEEPWDISGLASTKEEITIYAKWTIKENTVAFDLNGHGDEISSQTIDKFAKVAEPTAPTDDDYDFGGWFSDENLENAYDFDTEVTEGMTLHAKWTIKQYTVAFVLNGHGSAISSQTIDKFAKVTLPTAPTDADYDFGGWFSDEGLENAYNFNTEVTAASTLYAKWTIKQCTVTFNLNGHGSAVASQTIDKFTKAAEPTAPTDADYEFQGWYTDVAFENAYDFNTTVTEGMTLYAKWARLYTISFNANGGTGTKASVRMTAGTYTLPDGSDFSLAVGDFVGWATASNGSAIATETINVSQNTVLYAVWSGIKTEAQLRAAFTNGGSYHLDADILTNGELVLNAGKTLVLDLNGHVIDVQRKSRVIHTLGALTIKDGNPTATHPSYLEADDSFPTGGVLYNGYNSNPKTPALCGGGVYVEQNTFSMEGGTIYDCISNFGCGICLKNGSHFVATGGAIIKCRNTQGMGSGGGIYLFGSAQASLSNFTISGCSVVKYNYSGSFYGGGIYCAAGTSLVLNNVTITNCTSNSGAGIYSSGSSSALSTVTLANGSSITNCVSYEEGSAVAIENRYSTLTIDGKANGVSITGNYSRNYDDSASSLASSAVEMEGTLIVSGLVNISGNERLYKNGTSYEPKVYRNVRLNGSYCIFKVGEAGLASGSTIGVWKSTAPTAGSPVALTSATGGKAVTDADLAFFSSDEEAYEIYRDGDVLMLRVPE